MRNDDRDELDDLIDGVLPGYSSAEPLEGLEARVLQRVQAAGAARRSPWFYRLGFAIPALAALLFAGIALRMGWDSQPRATNATQKAAVSVPASPAPAIQVAEPKHSVPVRSLPKEEQFPTPMPITDEERALVAWAGRAPLEAEEAFAGLRKRSAEPIEIQPIQIPPLPSDGTR